MKPGVPLAIACGAVLALGAVDASAFCRTRTVASAPNYDSSIDGCWQEGLPLFWRNACVGYSIQERASRKVAYDTASDLISTAFTRWTGATCPADAKGRTRASIDVRDLGPVECATVEYVTGAANQNVIVFRDDNWRLPRELGVLGLTTVKYSATTGEIFGADMEINTRDMDPLALADPVKPGSYDFLSIVTHEAGHFLGLAHSDIEHTTMFATYNHDQGETFQRYLAPDDILGICSVYRPDGERSVLEEKVYPAPECNPTPRGGFSSACQEKPGARCDSSTSPAPPEGGAGWALAVAGALALVRARARARRSA